jgi:chromosome segregation ATPase
MQEIIFTDWFHPSTVARDAKRHEARAAAKAKTKSVVDNMTDGEKRILLMKMRYEARREAEIERSNLRHMMVERPLVEVETREQRSRRQEAEKEEQRQQQAERDRASKDRQMRELRRHELRLARAQQNNNGPAIDWGELLQSIAEGFAGLVDRVEALEAAVEELQGTTNGASKRLDFLSAKSQSGSEQSGRQIAVLEKNLEEQKDLVRDLRTDCRILQGHINALNNRPQELPIQVIREIIER